MSESRDGAQSNRASILRGVVIWFCCIGVVGGLGCATMGLLTKETPKTKAYFNTPILEDSVFALGRPDASLTKELGHEGAVVFLGKKHTYFLIEGGQELYRVAGSGLDGTRLSLVCPACSLFLDGKTIWGKLKLCYQPGHNAEQGADEEIRKLLSLGFTSGKTGVYELPVSVKGVLGPVAKVNTELPKGFTKSRDIAFYPSPSSMPPPDMGKILLLPLAVAIDVPCVAAGAAVGAGLVAAAVPGVIVVGLIEGTVSLVKAVHR